MSIWMNFATALSNWNLCEMWHVKTIATTGYHSKHATTTVCCIVCRDGSVKCLLSWPSDTSISVRSKFDIVQTLSLFHTGMYLFWDFFSFFGPLVPWSSRPPSSRHRKLSSPQCPAPLVPCSSGLLVSWSSVLFRSFFSNLSFTLFYYQFYIFTLSCVC